MKRIGRPPDASPTSAIVCERKLHLGPDEQLVVAGLVAEDGHGAARVELQIRRRPASSISPTDFHETPNSVAVPLHLVELVAEELIRIGRRTAEAALVAPSPSADGK